VITNNQEYSPLSSATCRATCSRTREGGGLSATNVKTGRNQSRVKSLTAKFEGYAPYQGVKEGFFKGQETTPSDDFKVVVSILPVYLTIICNTVKPLTPLDLPLAVFSVGSDKRMKP
jgi:hypothetical protein